MRTALRTVSASLIGGLIGVTGSGCASNPAPPVKIVRPSQQSGIATALVFDPPLTFHEEPIDLDRDFRGPAAFAGFEEPSVNYLDVFTENRQSTNGYDYVTRDSFSEKVGAVHR